MKVLKKIAVVILALIVVYFIVALFAPDSYEVSRSKTIDAPIDVVWEQVSQFNNWEAWSPWKEKDPSVTFTLDGADGMVGTTYKWAGDSDLSGVGYMKITDVSKHQNFNYELGFTEPWVMTSNGGFTITGDENTTEVVWKDAGEIGFIGRPLALFFNVDDMIGPDFERGLTKIDSVSKVINLARETNSVKESTFAGGIYLGKRFAMKIAGIDSALYANSYAELIEFTMEKELNIAGAPSDIIYDWNEETDSAVFSIVLKVDAETDVAESGLELIRLEETKALVYDFYGPYDQAGVAHEKLMNYLMSNELEMTIAVEEYLNDPATVNSPDEILTRIYYLLK